MPIVVECRGRQADKRVAQLILRERGARGADLIVLDVLGVDDGHHQGITMSEGMEGLHHLQFTRPVKSEAYQEGGTPGEPRVDPRKVEVTFIVRGHSAAERDRIESLLWRVVNRHVDCVLRMYPEAGSQSNWRELLLTAVESPVDQTKRLYNTNELARTHTVKLIACRAFWYSEVVEYNLQRSDMVQQPDGSWLGSVPVYNPADNDCWLEWQNGEMDVPETWILPDADRVYDQYNAPTPAQIGTPITHPLPLMQPGHEFLVSTYPTTPTLQIRPPANAPYGGSGDWARMQSEHFDYPLERSTPEVRHIPVRLKGGSVNSQISVFMVHRWDRMYGGEV